MKSAENEPVNSQTLTIRGHDIRRSFDIALVASGFSGNSNVKIDI